MSGLITNYERHVEPNKYAGAIQELIAAGDGAAYAIVGTTEKVEGVRGGTIANEIVHFQNAAREANFSAVKDSTEDQGDGTTKAFMVLVPKRTRTVKPKGETAEVADKPKK